MYVGERKYYCGCCNCSSFKLHNINIGVSMVDSNTGAGEDIKPTDIQTRAAGRLNAIKLFFYGLFRHAGLFLIGIFVGMGIVLKNPPDNKKLVEKIDVLQKEISEKSANLEVKNSVILN
jgi:hypothetical protein